MVPRYLKICLAICGTLILSGCDNPFGNNSSIWNQGEGDVGALNNDIACDITGIEKQLATDTENTYPWLSTNLTDKNQWIDVFFKTNRDGTPSTNDITTNTFRYFPLTSSSNPADISPYRVDPGVMAFVDGSYYGDTRFGGLDDSDARDHTNDLMMIPLVGQNREKMTEIQAPGIKELNGNTDYEIYTLDYSAYLDKRLSNFDPYKDISVQNFPAVIFVLYDPVKYASLPFAERAKLTETDAGTGKTYNLVGSSGHMYFKAYYSVYHFNWFFDTSTCELQDEYKMCIDGKDCEAVTPPWQFGACVTENATSMIDGQKCVKAEDQKNSLSNVISTKSASSADERRNPFVSLASQTKGFPPAEALRQAVRAGLDSLRSLGMTKLAYAADDTVTATNTNTTPGLWTRFKSGINNAWQKITDFMHISADDGTGEGLPGQTAIEDQLLGEVEQLISSGQLAAAQGKLAEAKQQLSPILDSDSSLAQDIQRKIDELQERLKRGLSVDGDDNNQVAQDQVQEIADGQKLAQSLTAGGWTDSSLSPRLHQQEYLNATFPAAGCKAQCDTSGETYNFDPFLPDGVTKTTPDKAPNASNGVCGTPSEGDCLKGNLRCTVAGVSGKNNPNACGNGKWQAEGHTCAADRTQGSCSNEPAGIGASSTNVSLVKLVNLWFTTKIASRVPLLAQTSNSWITQLSNSSLTNNYLIDTSATQYSYSMQSILGNALSKYLESATDKQLVEPLNASSNVGRNTILYDLATFVQNLMPNIPHNCTNDTSLDGNLIGQIQCAFAHAAYSTTVTQEDYDSLGITREGTTTDDQGFGLTDTLAKQQTKIDEITKSIQQQLSSLSNSGVDDQLKSGLQNATGSGSGSGDTPASNITDGMAGYTPASSVTTATPSCWYTPDPFIRVNNK